MSVEAKIYSHAAALAAGPTDLASVLGSNVNYFALVIQNRTGDVLLIGDSDGQHYELADGGEFELASIDAGISNSDSSFRAEDLFLNSTAGGNVNILYVSGRY